MMTFEYEISKMYILMALYFNYLNTSYNKYGYLNLILCFNTMYRF